MDRESLIRSVGEYATQGIAIGEADPDDGAVMTFFWINAAFTDITGFRPEGVIGRTAGVLAGEATDPVVRSRIIRRMQAWETFTEELKLTRADGTTYWGELTFRLVEEESDPGQGPFWVLLVRNVSDQMHARAQISDLSRVAQTNTDMVGMIDAQLQIVWANEALEGFAGPLRYESRPPMLTDYIAFESDLAETLPQMLSALRVGEAQRHKLTLTGAKGARCIVDADFRPVIDEVHGRTDGFVVVLHDISAQEVKDSRYRAIVRESTTAIAVADARKFLMVNTAFAELLKTNPEQIEGRALTDQVESPLLKQALELAMAVLADGAQRSDECTLPVPGGGKKHLQLRSFRSYDALARKHIVCIVATDITGVRETEAQLSSAQLELARQQSRLWAAIDASPDGVVLCDAQDRLVHCNLAFRAQIGPVAKAITPGMTFAEITRLGVDAGIWDIGDARPEAWLKAHLADRAAGHLQDRILTLTDGRSILCREAKLRNGERLSMRIDATEMQADKDRLRVAERAAKQAEERLTAAIAALDDQLVIFDAEDRLVLANKGDIISNALGTDESAITGLTFEQILRSGVEQGLFLEAVGQEEAFIKERMARHRAPGAPMIQRWSDGRVFKVIEKRTARGDTVSLRVDLTVETRQREAMERYATELRQSHKLLEQRNAALVTAREALEHRSLHDPLTDLPNRRYLDKELTRRAETLRHSQSIAVLQVDLDRFKQINDTYGHAIGDKVLLRAARALRETVSEDDFVARIGGDEFLVVISDPELMSLADTAQAIINAISQPAMVDGILCRIGASVGIALARDVKPEVAVANLPIEADIALYAAKGQGRNRWVVFSPDLKSRNVRRQRISDALNTAIETGALEPVYQPQVHAETENLVGVEALLRWSDPELGVIDPPTILSVAEETGIEADLDKALFQRIQADDAAWRKAGIVVPKIALNVTGRRLRSPQLVEDIRNSGIAPERLTIEVLETIFVDGEDRVLSWNIDQLREMGASIALDDFGTGHSSIIGVLKLKPHAIKIDKSFVDQALGVREAELLVGSVIELGKSLGLEVVAEGVETPAQADQLRALGCDTFQGFTFGAPMTASEIARLYGDRIRSAAPPR